jgi:hypothetical protein
MAGKVLGLPVWAVRAAGGTVAGLVGLLAGVATGEILGTPPNQYCCEAEPYDPTYGQAGGIGASRMGLATPVRKRSSRTTTTGAP